MTMNFKGSIYFLFTEREAEVLKPLASVEIVEKDEASFETEISEDDIPGEWKLGGQVLTRSPVMFHFSFLECWHKSFHLSF